MQLKKVMNLTDNTGVDVAIEAVGVPETFELCQEIISMQAAILPMLAFMEKAQFFTLKLYGQKI